MKAGRHRIPCARGRLASFTLVEVVLAVGIVAFAVLPMMALVPIGMGVYQDAQIASVETQIIDQMSDDLQNSSYANLFDGSGNFLLTGTYYYDVEGRSLTGTVVAPIYTLAMSATTFLVSGTGSTLSFSSNSSAIAKVITMTLNFHNTNNSTTFSTLVVNKGY